MPDEISGLPAHVLLVHAVVVLVPLAALVLVLAALWPAFRRRAGMMVPLLALVALVMVPITTSAGEWLERRVPRSHLIHEHTELGDTLLPWALGLFVLAAAVWVLYRWNRSPFSEHRATSAADTDNGADGGTGEGAEGQMPVPQRPRGLTALRVVIAVLALAVSVGAVVQTYRIGDSGARAAWQGEFHQNAISGHGHGDHDD